MSDTIIRDLGGGLVLRRAVPADTEKLVDFHARLHSSSGEGKPDFSVGSWVRDLMRGDHPSFRPCDFTLVEESATGEVISSMNLISQTWSYDGLPFGVGQPELVATRRDHRRRGLIRAQFEVVHGWSAERGELVQAITGIPNYYRQFGYEMALSLSGGRMGYEPHVPRLGDGAAEGYLVRQAREADLPSIAGLYQDAARRGPIACVRSEADWRYELLGKSESNVNRRELRVIETRSGEFVGFVAHPAQTWRQAIYATAYELRPGISWLAVTPSVVRYLWATGEAYASRDAKQLEAFALGLGAEHPVYGVLRSRLPRSLAPYAWYIRVPDMPGFLRHVAPALERRLAASVAAGHSGELRVSTYRGGTRLALERGRVVGVEAWAPEHPNDADAAFPGLSLLHLIFGHKSLDELKSAFADCWTAGDEAQVLLEALFPKRPSHVWELR